LLDLISDILDLSQIDAGRLQLRPTDFHLGELLEGVREMFAGPALTRGISLVLEVDPDLPERIHADAGRLRQVVANFLGNACKFSRPARITISAARDADRLRISVRDRGPAIEAELARRLFQPFVRLPDAGAPGSGLGLAICERLACLMGGEVGLRV